ncbi:MAG: nucleoside-diphosphate sugar epimerase/dehydratase [Oscillospiraceae bacterium]|nr:nucleoside-diphosphate sugar epimerase/dehydratase [Oscillospiraceae bacterium]
MMNKRGTGSKRKFKLEHWHIVAVLLSVYDIMAVNFSYFLALWLRFDGVFSSIPKEYLTPYIHFIPINTVVSILIFYIVKMYHGVWKFAGSTELFRTVIGSVSASAAHIILITVFFERMPISYYLWGACFQIIFLVAARFSYRFMILESRRFKKYEHEDNVHRVMIVGAGDAGQMIFRSVLKNASFGDRVVCFIDDNPNLVGRYFDGIPVVGTRDDILINVEKHKIDKIYVAIPSASRENVRDIINICSETNCEVKNLPDFYQYANSDITVEAMRKVSVEDLLGREPIKTEMTEVFSMIRGKVILVTGGGGSIGSELCRQIAAHEPKRLIILDIYENSAYSIQQELKEKYPSLALNVLIGSVRDSRRLDSVFNEFRPDIVYHAAAHKHVPLMEDSPCEAIKNNVIGTYKTAYAAMMYNCRRFVLISTDKAVNPTNIMGASKRLCEMVVQTFDKSIKEHKTGDIPRLFTHASGGDEPNLTEIPENVSTEFVAVRFGNVLGSNGSVVPLFKHQIEKGGPVTVTHPDIIRYFMTIPEAVSLVLLAGTYAKGGEIFVLDMGSPVKIDTLARNLIKLSGLKPDVDIKIEYTGLRPGEKLFEEKLMSEEGMRTTPNKLIHIGNPIPINADKFRTGLERLMTEAYGNSDDIRHLVAQMVPTYKPSKK